MASTGPTPVDAFVLVVSALVPRSTALDHSEPTGLGRSITQVLQTLPDRVVTLLGGRPPVRRHP